MTSPPSPVPLDRTGRIAANLPCAHCRYILRGLKPDQRCPECGMPVLETLQCRPLVSADPRWLRRLRLGLLILLIPAVIGVVLRVVEITWDPLGSASTGRSISLAGLLGDLLGIRFEMADGFPFRWWLPHYVRPPLLPRFDPLVVIFESLPLCIGCALILMRPLGPGWRDANRASRLAGLWAIAAFFLIMLVHWTVWCLTGGVGPRWPWWWLVETSLFWISVGLLGVYLATLAQRLGSRRLSRALGIVGVLLPALALSLHLVVPWICGDLHRLAHYYRLVRSHRAISVDWAGPPEWRMNLDAVLATTTALCMSLLLFLLAVLLVRLHSAIREAQRMGERSLHSD